MDLARAGRLNLARPGDDQWLPPSLMSECFWMVDQITESYKGFKVRIIYANAHPTLRLTADYVDLELEGRFTLVDGKVETVKVIHLKPVPENLEAGKKRAKRRDRHSGGATTPSFDDDGGDVDLPPGL